MQSRQTRRSGVLIAGAHPLIRQRIRQVIEQEGDLRICGEAESLRQTLELLAHTPTRMVIMDLSLKDSHPLDLIKDIHSRWPQLGILVFSIHEEALYAERVLRAGARGYITEAEASTHLLEAVRRILEGEIYINEAVARHIACKSVSHFSRPQNNKRSVELLTDRELQVFGWIGQGYSTQEIAHRLHIHPKTVETYRARIKERLGIDDAHHLLQHAIRWSRYNLGE